MENTGKPLTRDSLVSMQVIDARGRLLGKVKDVAFSVGKMGISLTVESDEGEVQNIEWDQVQAASDFIILKPQPIAQTAYQPQQQATPSSYQPAQATAQPVQPAQPAQQQQTTQPVCPTCHKPLTWIPQYQRWYCYNDKKYV